MKIRLAKIKELEDALHPNNIVVGNEYVGILRNQPKVGECFFMDYEDDDTCWFRSSTVTEVIDEFTFKTLNSIYRFESLEKEEDTEEVVIDDLKSETENWLGWLQQRIPELKESSNAFWVKQALDGNKPDYKDHTNAIYQILGQFGPEHEPIKKKFREYCEFLIKKG